MFQAKQPISLVVTVKNDAAGLQRLLASLVEQTRLPEEVILVVADSTDQTLAVAQAWQPANIKVRVAVLPEANRSVGRNYGVNLAQHDLIVFTDAGCVPELTWLAELTAPFKDSKVKLVSGYTAGEGQNSWKEAQIPFVLVPLVKVEDHPLPATRNMAIRRTVFTDIGGFRADLNYAEDFELARRLRAAGIQAMFIPEAVVHWRPRATIGGFFRMIIHLTAGDITAGIIRPGLLTMWLRYLVFSAILLCQPIVGLILYLAYLIFKTAQQKFSYKKTYLVAMGLQIIGDLAVLVGSLIGVGVKIQKIRT